MQWKIPENKSALGLFSSIEKISSDPRWQNTINFKIPKAAHLIEGGATEQDSKGKWKTSYIKFKESTTGPAQIVLDSGKSYDAPRIFMALTPDGTKYTDKILVKGQSGETVKRFINWGDVKPGSEIEIQFKFGKIWKTPMGLTVSLEVVQAIFYPPPPKNSTAFAGKRCVEPTDEELLAIMEGGASSEAKPQEEIPQGGGGYVPTFEEDAPEVPEVPEAKEEETLEAPKEFTSPVKESSSSSAPGAPKKKRKTAEE
jgi:hypothetical protein